MGFGYRAAYIAKTAQHIWQHHSSHYLHDLRCKPYKHARSELMKLHGVGAKVTIICACFINLYDIYCSVIYIAFIINLQEYLLLPGPWSPEFLPFKNLVHLHGCAAASTPRAVHWLPGYAQPLHLSWFSLGQMRQIHLCMFLWQERLPPAFRSIAVQRLTSDNHCPSGVLWLYGSWRLPNHHSCNQSVHWSLQLAPLP